MVGPYDRTVGGVEEIARAGVAVDHPARPRRIDPGRPQVLGDQDGTMHRDPRSIASRHRGGGRHPGDEGFADPHHDVRSVPENGRFFPRRAQPSREGDDGRSERGPIHSEQE
jgi:hypothetical protein